MDLDRAARADAQLFGAGGVVDENARSSIEPVLPNGTRGVSLTAGYPCHACDDHRQPGHDHRCLLCRPAIGPARHDATSENPAHQRERLWANLCAGGQLDTNDPRADSRANLPEIEQPRCCLWNRCDGHDVHFDDDDRRSYGQGLELAEMAGLSCYRRFPDRRWRVSVLEPH